MTRYVLRSEVTKGYDYKTNHRKPPQTTGHQNLGRYAVKTVKSRHTGVTTTNHCKPPPEGRRENTRGKKSLNGLKCPFCGLNLTKARRNIIIYSVIALYHSCCLHDFIYLCKQLFYIEKHWHVVNKIKIGYFEGSIA